MNFSPDIKIDLNQLMLFINLKSNYHFSLIKDLIDDYYFNTDSIVSKNIRQMASIWAFIGLNLFYYLKYNNPNKIPLAFFDEISNNNLLLKQTLTRLDHYINLNSHFIDALYANNRSIFKKLYSIYPTVSLPSGLNNEQFDQAIGYSRSAEYSPFFSLLLGFALGDIEFYARTTGNTATDNLID